MRQAHFFRRNALPLAVAGSVFDMDNFLIDLPPKKNFHPVSLEFSYSVDSLWVLGRAIDMWLKLANVSLRGNPVL